MPAGENREIYRYQSTSQSARLVRIWQQNAGLPVLVATLAPDRFALAASRHQFMNCFARSLTLVQNGVHLFGDGHLDPAGTR